MEILMIDIVFCFFLFGIIFAIVQGLGERAGVLAVLRFDYSNLKEQFKTKFRGEPIIFFVIEMIAVWLISHTLYYWIIRQYTIGW